jgi:cytochrome c551/c552
MKHVVIAAAALSLFVAAGSALAGAGEDLIASNKCGKCHTATTTKKAPSFASIAEKYKGKADASATLVDVLKTGGKVDHDTFKGSDADLKAMVEVVLSTK